MSHVVEEWRPAPGVPHLEVSNFGRVRSWINSRRVRRQEPLLVGHQSRGGYWAAGPGVWVHRLVCEAWHGPAPEGRNLVRHLDDDRDNNRPENLAWGDFTENAHDRGRNGRNGPRPGPRKLSEPEVLSIRRRASSGETGAALAREFGLTDSTIYAILKRRTWGHL